ncbi:hypothetical protein [Flavobacterium capsici]|uniref:Uncharacterized protein n=1 Tax=Flavobacterium capsici TaxID=3075618 RepID=A0AA96F2G5_9FLAO|nr:MULTISPECIES: hypothetical protein [unclassified Flavobacterium]WNM18635.1 hypothetical protein RN608_11515 [Flavobacterium sp. PMR2A8]WNM22686.1 hypothetical protein RN605_04815 [Flavobacterium sp. PMTSA4]
MLNFEKLKANDLWSILENKKHCVIAIDQITANTIGNDIYTKMSYSIPKLSIEDVIDVVKFTTLFDSNDKQSFWNTFILLASNKGADIYFTNTNDTDCYVEFKFNN